MQNNPLISILIVAYNPGAYLRNTIRSCLDQTYENTEILILDNASSEDIAHYFPTDPEELAKIRLIKSNENLGPYRGLNRLLDEAKWDYIAIQDHDDIWHREKLEKQVEFLGLHPEYVGCGTNTIMYYEADGKYFEYFLEEKNYYTIHPSLLFRYDGQFRYDTSETEYMCDAWSLKNNLCHGGKKIANIREPLTLHLIKKTSGNYSYRWHTVNMANIKRAYKLHPPLYATFTLLWEIKRKIAYPILNILWLGDWVNPIERIPFRMMGKKIKTTQWDEWFQKYI
jgi:glycosyltransferase involved in cell wall biosynthesis